MKTMNMQNKIETIQANEYQEPDWEFLDYAAELEKEWRESLPRYTDKELLEMFPEAKRIIPVKIQEWRSKRRKVIEVIKSKLRIVHTKSAPENQWFWKEVIKQLDGHEVVEMNKHISRLCRQLTVGQNRKQKGNRLTEERIQQALAASLVDIAMQNMKLRKAGKTFMGLCPFHNERHPSFHIYPHNNSFYCYGCNKGGNVINFVRELQGLSFREAVEYLAG